MECHESVLCYAHWKRSLEMHYTEMHLIIYELQLLWDPAFGTEKAEKN